MQLPNDKCLIYLSLFVYNTAQFHRNTSGWMGGHALNE